MYHAKIPIRLHVRFHKLADMNDGSNHRIKYFAI